VVRVVAERPQRLNPWVAQSACWLAALGAICHGATSIELMKKVTKNLGISHKWMGQSWPGPHLPPMTGGQQAAGGALLQLLGLAR